MTRLVTSQRTFLKTNSKDKNFTANELEKAFLDTIKFLKQGNLRCELQTPIIGRTLLERYHGGEDDQAKMRNTTAGLSRSRAQTSDIQLAEEHRFENPI